MNDRILKIFLVAFLLCVTCSTLVSTAAVLLGPMQVENKELDKRKNILYAAGLYSPDENVTKEVINERYASIRPKVIDFDSGDVSGDVDPETYDQKQAAKSPKMSRALTSKEDIAQIKRRAHLGLVYEVLNAEGEVATVILPIKGYGLWSTLYGFLALDKDGNTVKGITYYDHAETPGLGGEVDNPAWKSLWKEKRVYNDSMEVVLRVVKGTANKDSAHEIDGLSGATITAQGVSRMIAFWLGDMGYGAYLKKYFIHSTDEEAP